MNVKDIGKGILAVTITVLVFYSIGLIPGSFLEYISFIWCNGYIYQKL